MKTTTPKRTYKGYDKKMIQWLYNPSVKAGMNEAGLDAVIDSL